MEKKYDNGDLKCPPLDFYIAEPKRSKCRSDLQGNEGPTTLGRAFIDICLSFDRLPFNLRGISGELFEQFESAVNSLIKYARITAMTNLCRRHSTAAGWEPLWHGGSCRVAVRYHRYHGYVTWWKLEIKFHLECRVQAPFSLRTTPQAAQAHGATGWPVV